MVLMHSNHNTTNVVVKVDKTTKTSTVQYNTDNTNQQSMPMSIEECYGIKINLDNDNRLTSFSKKLLHDYYLIDSESSPQQAFARAAVCYCQDDLELAQRIYNYASKGWFMFSSPVLSNAPAPGKKTKSLPISCFLGYVPDTLEGLIDHSAELRWLSVLGGGVGGHWSDVRSVSDKAPSPIPFLKTIDADMTAYRQGKTRKGSYAAYMDVSHPDLLEFLSIRIPTGGDINRKCFNLHNAVNITDDFVEAVFNNAEWKFIDPHDGTVRDTIMARDLWQRILEIRFRTGEPYINHIDEANKYLPEPLKKLGLEIHGSNLCNEIHLPTSKDRTAVCCLSSLNVELYDEWKDTNIIRDCIRFLDNILDYFIEHAPDSIARAKYSATQERSLGLGTMGFHSFLQSKQIPFGSIIAKSWNYRIYKHIKDEADKETRLLAQEKGAYPDYIEAGFDPNSDNAVRNAHLIALAPNANNSIIAGTSPSVEPWKANAYTHRTRAGSFLVKNKHLESVLQELGKNTDEVWSDIIINDGSVQHLTFLDDRTKDIFRTAFEIDQRWVIDLARDRQEFICQGQSINIFIPANSDKSYVNNVHLRAFMKEGTGIPLKGLYYLRTNAGHTAEKVSTKVQQNQMGVSNTTASPAECLACEG